MLEYFKKHCFSIKCTVLEMHVVKWRDLKVPCSLLTIQEK